MMLYFLFDRVSKQTEFFPFKWLMIVSAVVMDGVFLAFYLCLCYKFLSTWSDAAMCSLAYFNVRADSYTKLQFIFHSNDMNSLKICLDMKIVG